MGVSSSKDRSSPLPPNSILYLVLDFVSFDQRLTVNEISRAYKQLTNSPFHYKWLCFRLDEERNIYSPHHLQKLTPPLSWERIFKENWVLRDLWTQTNSSGEEHELEGSMEYSLAPRTKNSKRFKVSVFARFRPSNKKQKMSGATFSIEDEKADNAGAEDMEKENEGGKKVTLPLHQRLTMLKVTRGIKSKSGALKALAQEGLWFTKKWEDINSAMQNQMNISNDANDCDSLEYAFAKEQKKVPFAPFKIDDNGKVGASNRDEDGNGKGSSHSRVNGVKSITASVQTVDPATARVVMIAPDVGLREFYFDGVFNERASQDNLYETCCRGLTMDVLNGYNATLLSYGQTSSGKTHTMFGNISASISSHCGIIPRACNEILNALTLRNKRNEQARIHASSEMYISYVEIFGEHVVDLLKGGARCGHSKVASQRFVLSGAAEVKVSQEAEILKCLQQGEAQKRVTATAMNDRSSRAHSMFIITIKQTIGAKSASSRFFLVDLGGSERIKKSQVESGQTRVGLGGDMFSTGFHLGEHMREAVNINLGLLSLKKCIEALNSQSSYVPYQDSKLTMILSQGLGGNSRTAVIVCGTMDATHAEETISTMRFGERCSLVETEARQNASKLAALLAKLDAEIKAIEAEILAKERWEMVEKQRDDLLAEQGTVEAAVGGKEIVKVSRLVGAEAERKYLETLLARRAELTGSQDAIILQESAKVKGFGREFAAMYGLGSAFDESAEAATDNDRFKEKVDESELPAVIRARGKAKQWNQNLTQDSKKLEALAKKANRSKLVYSGISA